MIIADIYEIIDKTLDRCSENTKHILKLTKEIIYLYKVIKFQETRIDFLEKKIGDK